jgi:hypothetical protein
MRSNEVSAPGLAGVRPMPVGPRHAIDRLRSRDRLEAIARLRSVARALDDIDVAGWDDTDLMEHLDEISLSLCAIDTQLSRVADAVRARGLAITEPLAA